MNDLPNEVMEEVELDVEVDSDNDNDDDEGEKARVSPRRRTSNGMNCLYDNDEGDDDVDDDMLT